MQNVTTFTKKLRTRPATKMRKKIRNWVVHVQRASSLYEGGCMQKAVLVKAKACPHLRLIKTDAKVIAKTGFLALALLGASDMYAPGGALGDELNPISSATGIYGKLTEINKIIDQTATDPSTQSIAASLELVRGDPDEGTPTYGLIGADNGTSSDAVHGKTGIRDKLKKVKKLIDGTETDDITGVLITVIGNPNIASPTFGTIGGEASDVIGGASGLGPKITAVADVLKDGETNIGTAIIAIMAIMGAIPTT